MGYQTDYKMSVSYCDPQTGELSPCRKAVERKIRKTEIARYGETTYDVLMRYGWNDVKWYDHDDDVKQLSLQFSDVLFTLEGEGEEAGDIWKKYYLNGKVQVARAQITFEELDIGKLR